MALEHNFHFTRDVGGSFGTSDTFWSCALHLNRQNQPSPASDGQGGVVQSSSVRVGFGAVVRMYSRLRRRFPACGVPV